MASAFKENLLNEKTASLFLPLFSSIPAGFPSPADNFIENELDLNELLVQHPMATFFVRVEGNSMQGASIHAGDILVVDRAVSAASGKIVVALLNGEFTVKRLIISEKKEVFLQAENSSFSSIKITKECDFQVWGVVTYVIHKAL